jgi:hypothetical protein
MSEIHEVPAAIAAHAHVDQAAYEDMYRRSVEDNEGFWAEQALRIDWIKPFILRERGSAHSLVLRRHSERLLQLRGPSSCVQRR